MSLFACGGSLDRMTRGLDRRGKAKSFGRGECAWHAMAMDTDTFQSPPSRSRDSTWGGHGDGVENWHCKEITIYANPACVRGARP